MNLATLADEVITGNSGRLSNWSVQRRRFQCGIRVTRVKAGKIGFIHGRLAWGDIVKFAGSHPVFELIHHAVEVLEKIDDEEQRLIVVDFKGLVDDPFELQRIALDIPRFNSVFDFAVGAQQSAAINFQIY